MTITNNRGNKHSPSLNTTSSTQIDMDMVNNELHILHTAKENKHMSSHYLIRIIGEDGIKIGAKIRYIGKCPNSLYIDHIRWCEGIVTEVNSQGIVIQTDLPIPITLPIGKPVAVSKT